MLNFPQNRDILDVRSQNTFSRVWHGFFEAVYAKLNASEAVTSITTADIGAAGGAYSQVYAQSQTDLINELKTQVNELLAALEK